MAGESPITRWIIFLINRSTEMSAALDRLTADVTNIHDQVEKLIAVNADISAQLKALAAKQPADDSDALNTLAATLEGASADATAALNPAPAPTPPADTPPAPAQ